MQMKYLKFQMAKNEERMTAYVKKVNAMVEKKKQNKK